MFEMEREAEYHPVTFNLSDVCMTSSARPNVQAPVVVIDHVDGNGRGGMSSTSISPAYQVHHSQPSQKKEELVTTKTVNSTLTRDEQQQVSASSLLTTSQVGVHSQTNTASKFVSRFQMSVPDKKDASSVASTNVASPSPGAHVRNRAGVHTASTSVAASSQMAAPQNPRKQPINLPVVGASVSPQPAASRDAVTPEAKTLDAANVKSSSFVLPQAKTLTPPSTDTDDKADGPPSRPETAQANADVKSALEAKLASPVSTTALADVGTSQESTSPAGDSANDRTEETVVVDKEPVQSDSEHNGAAEMEKSKKRVPFYLCKESISRSKERSKTMSAWSSLAFIDEELFASALATCAPRDLENEVQGDEDLDPDSLPDAIKERIMGVWPPLPEIPTKVDRILARVVEKHRTTVRNTLKSRPLSVMAAPPVNDDVFAVPRPIKMPRKM